MISAVYFQPDNSKFCHLLRCHCRKSVPSSSALLWEEVVNGDPFCPLRGYLQTPLCPEEAAARRVRVCRVG